MPNLVDLRAALSDNRANHVVGDVNLLSQWLTRHDTASRTARSRCARLGRLRCPIWVRLVRASAPIRGMGCTPVRHGGLIDRCGCRLAMEVRDAISARRCAVGVRMMSLEGVRMSILSSGRLRDIRHHLHPTRDGASWASAAGGVSRRGRSAEAFGELFNQGNSDIVGRNVNGVRNTKYDQGTLSRQGKTSIRRIQAGSRSLLDLANPAAALANNGANQDMRD